MIKENISKMISDIERYYDALDVIAKFESGDSIYLKRNIRNEIAKLDEIIDKNSDLLN